MHHSVAGQFTIRKSDWKLIEGSGDGDYPRKSEVGIDIKTLKPRRDPDTGKWVELDYFQLKPDGEFQLYNLKSDPKEQNNLSDNYPEKVKEMYGLLNSYRQRNSSLPH